ncbi:MAG TPA: Lar family restriction alleviation protein [Longimicrobium sp.]|nr:Lar family restriction alleviation protein [Longimicrobium sp.]
MHLPRAVVGPLRPCPFCGGAATVEPSPWMEESVRVACGNDACRVQPRTEYLLLRYAAELSAAWNGRAPGAVVEDAA